MSDGQKGFLEIAPAAELEKQAKSELQHDAEDLRGKVDIHASAVTKAGASHILELNDPFLTSTAQSEQPSESEIRDDRTVLVSEQASQPSERAADNRHYRRTDDGAILANYGNGDSRKLTVDENDRVQTLSYFNQRTGLTHEYSRIGAPAGEWGRYSYRQRDVHGRVVSQATWTGELKWEDGTLCIKDANQSRYGIPDEFWKKVGEDGVAYRERKNADGSTQAYNDSWGLLRMTRPDGSGVECSRAANGALLSVDHVDSAGNRISWKLNQQRNQWVANRADIAESDRPPVNQQGELEFLSIDGTRNKIGLNGRIERTTSDGSRIISGTDGLAETIIRPNGDYRKIIREDGNPIGFTDYTKTHEEKKTTTGLKDFSVDEAGNIKYTDEDERKTVLKPDGTQITYAADDSERVKQISCTDGSTRQVHYDSQNGRIVQLLDHVFDGKQWADQLWQLRTFPAEAGIPFSAEAYEHIDMQSGKVLERRTGVKFDEFANYTFESTNGSRLASSSVNGFKSPAARENPPNESPAPETRTDTRRTLLPWRRQAPNQCTTRDCQTRPEQESPQSVAELQPAEIAPTRDQHLQQLAAENVSITDDIITASYPNGDSRALRLEEGTNKVTHLDYFNKSENRRYQYNLQSDSESSTYEFFVRDGNTGQVLSKGIWQGNMEWRDGATLATRPASAGDNASAFWRILDMSGTRTFERTNAGGSKQIFDSSGQYNLCRLMRPDGSAVECTRTEGKLREVHDSASRNKWVYDDNSKQWVSNNPEILPSATAPVNQQGELSYTDRHGSRTRVNVNGEITRWNNDGTTAVILAGDVTRFTRADGSYREFQRSENGTITGFTDFNQDSSVREVVEEITDAALTSQGYLEYTTKDGTHIVEGAFQSRVETRSTTPEKVLYPNGDTRAFTVKPGSEQLQAVVHFNKQTNTTREYTRSDADPNKWNVTIRDARGQSYPGGVWSGDMSFRDGNFSVKGDNVKAPPGCWHERDAAGKEYYGRDNADGSRQRFEIGGKGIVNVFRPDGSRLECLRINGEAVQIKNVDKDGQELSWTYDRTKQQWISNSSEIQPSASIPIDEHGQLVYRDRDSAIKIRLDGSIQRQLDGVRIEASDNGMPVKIHQKNGDSRVILYEDGKPTGFVDYAKDGAEKQRRENLENMKVSETGDVSFTVDGARVVERADLSRISFVPGSSTLVDRVTAADGSYRQFIRNEAGDELAIKDVVVTKTGEIASLCVRRENIASPAGPGGLSNDYDRIDAKTGKVLEQRFDVNIDQFGDYSYIDKRGQERLSRAGKPSTGDFNAAGVAEAHEQLLQVIADRFKNDKRTEAFAEMMKGFERRMKDTIIRRTAIGEDEQKVCQEVEKEITQTYESVARMLDGDAKGFDNADRRASLAEALMYLVMEPQTAKQAGRNSCWFMSQWNETLARYPGKLSKIFADVSLTGSCTDRHGEVYKFTQQDLAQVQPNHGVGWSISKAAHDSQPSPAVDRLERVLLRIGGWDTYRWQRGGYAGHAKTAIEKVVPDSIDYIGGQYPQTREARLALFREGGAVKSGGPRHVNNMFVRAVELDGQGRLLNRLSRRDDDDDDSSRRRLFGLFAGDQYEKGDRLIALIKDPKAFVERGEAASTNLYYPAPGLGKQSILADRFQPSEFRPGRSLNTPSQDNRPRLFAFLRRR